ncbi:Phosphatidylinositol transfer protein sfh5 [Paramyrothecium foliicola]|nr:Phosphatidylinositol transfer protein sfh5 [Paramyrothecium foliicola]
MSAEQPATAEKPLDKLNARLPEILKAVGHGEMWGVELQGADHVPTQVVLQKFLRANNNDAAAADKQLVAALEWRKQYKPLELVNATFDKSKFADLGYLTVHRDDAGKDVVFTWNIYGAVKDNKATFGDVKEFIRWRAALMEMSVQKLNLNAVTELIPEGGEDPYQMYQVHDYQSTSFLRMDPAVKAASRETIQTFATAYPELLAHKYFVNVPFFMGWMYAAMKLVLAPATLRKFHPMNSGLSLAAELPSISASLPVEYGGKGPSVKEGLTVALAEPSELKQSPQEPVAAAKAVDDATTETPAEQVQPVEVKPAEVSGPIVPEVAPATEAKETTPAVATAPATEVPAKDTEQKVVA